MHDAKIYVKKLLNSYQLNEPFNDNIIYRILQFYKCNNGKKTNNIEYMMIEKCKYNEPVLFLKDNNNDQSFSISYIHCLEVLYDLYDERVDILNNIKSAFRTAINTQTSHYYLSCNKKYCTNCLSTSNLEVDHKNVPFQQIWDEFILNNNINITNIAITKSTDKKDFRYYLVDSQLNNEWYEYHKNKAQLQLLCQTCNNSKGASKYRSKITKRNIIVQ